MGALPSVHAILLSTTALSQPQPHALQPLPARRRTKLSPLTSSVLGTP